MSSGRSALAGAQSALLSGDVARARRMLDDALAATDDPRERAELLCLRARVAVLSGDGRELAPVVVAAADEVEAVDPLLAGRLLVEFVLVKLYLRDRDIVDHAKRARDLVATGDVVTRARADTALGLAYVFVSRFDEAQDYLLRSADLIRVGGPADEVAQLLQEVVVGLASLERYGEALVLCRRYIRAVRALGADGLLPIVLCYLANTAYFTSDFDQMEMAAAEALKVARATDQPGIAAYASGCLGITHAMHGDLDQAVEELEQSVAALEPAGLKVLAGLSLMGLGLVELSRGDWEAAVVRYGALREFFIQLPPLPGIMHWRADWAEAAWRAGRYDEARVALDELSATTESHGPWERAVTARVRGLLAATPTEAGASYAEAMALHAQSPSVLERARTELVWAELLADEGRTDDARQHAESARGAFAEIGAVLWAGRADRVLARCVDRRTDPSRVPAGTSAAEEAATVRGFGPLTIVHRGDEQRVALDHPGRLLRHLVAAGGSLHSEQAIDRLWPEASSEIGAARLRNVLSRTRRRHGPLVVREGSLLRWAEDVVVDVDRFRDLSRRALQLRVGAKAAEVAREAVDLYRGDLLPMERYDDAVVAERERLRLRYLAMLDLLAEHEQAAGRPDAAAAHLRTALEADELDEARYARLAALLLDQGRSAQARAVIADAARAMARLGLEPSPRLAEIARHLSGGTDA